MPSSLNSSLGNWGCDQRGDAYWKVLGTALVARWPVLGDPASVSGRHAKHLVGAPKIWYGMACDLGGTSRETRMAGS